LQNSKYYTDSIHGFRAFAPSKTMAWMLIRNECVRLKLPIPTYDKINEELSHKKIKK